VKILGGALGTVLCLGSVLYLWLAYLWRRR
jgi:hypothetical protein